MTLCPSARRPERDDTEDVWVNGPHGVKRVVKGCDVGGALAGSAFSVIISDTRPCAVGEA